MTVGERALGDGAAGVHDDEVVGEPLGLLEGVGRHDDGRARVALLGDEVPHVEPAVRVEARRRLVEEEHLGAAEQRGRRGRGAASAHRRGGGPSSTRSR